MAAVTALFLVVMAFGQLAAAVSEEPHSSNEVLELAAQRSVHLAHLEEVAQDPATHFRHWAQRHKRPYLLQNDEGELQRRFQIWSENLAYVQAYNAKHTTHWLGLNSLADLTIEEYRGRFLGFDGAAYKRQRDARRASNALPKPFKYAAVDDGALPKAVDWRKEGAVSEVKNQQQCGSCWAFSTTGSIEGVNAIFSKELVSLSEQELVDCDTEQDKGCNGGLMDYAFEFVIKNKGLDTETHYPYQAVAGECEKKHLRHHVVTIDGYEDVPENDELSLRKAAAHQPVSVAIEADQKAFQLYVGGVFSDESCGTELDHGVLVVGYGPDPTSGSYYIVKNSWGADWGEKGYIRLKANVEAKEGLCGIAMAASYPTKTTPNPPKPGPEPPEPPSPEPGPGPSPGPGPVQCDETSECPPSTTCCCISEFLSVCIQWGCCPIVDATCCEDHMHCCPPTLPKCDTAGGRCLPGSGPGAALLQPEPWRERLPAPARRDFGALARLWMRGRGGGGPKTMRSGATA